MAEAALTPIVRQPNGAQNWAISALIAAAAATAHQARNRQGDCMGPSLNVTFCDWCCSWPTRAEPPIWTVIVDRACSGGGSQMEFYVLLTLDELLGVRVDGFPAAIGEARSRLLD